MTFSRDAYVGDLPWLAKPDQRMVIGDDLDSLMSAALLHHHLGLSIDGCYTGYKSVWASDSQSLRDAIWVDLDINQNDIRSIGHHIFYERHDEDMTAHSESANPNIRRGVFKRRYKGRAGDHGADCTLCPGNTFPHKYPLATVHLLGWLHEICVPDNEISLALYMLPDSTWINAQSHKYRANVLDWSENCIPHRPLLTALDLVDSRNFEETMKSRVFHEIIARGFRPGRGQSQSQYLGLRGHQCQFDDSNT